MLGVSGATYGNLTPPPTSGRRLPDGAPTEGDRYAPSESGPGIYGRPNLRPRRPSPTPRLAAWSALSAMLASGSGMLAFLTRPSREEK